MKSRIVAAALGLLLALSVAWLAFAGGTTSRARLREIAARADAGLTAAIGSQPWLPGIPEIDRVVTSAAERLGFPRWTPDRRERSAPQRAPGEIAAASAGTIVLVRGGTPVVAGASSSPTTNAAPIGGAVTAAASAAQLADAFEACRSGAQGGGFDPATGLWGWTCGNFNWHAAVEPSQASAFYRITCSGDGTAQSYSGPGARSCFRAGETRWIGVLHALGSAIDHTAPGGRVYLPDGVYVDTGCGTLSDGTTRARCPPVFNADWRRMSTYATTGDPGTRFAIQTDRGVVVIGEHAAVPEELDPADPTVTIDRPRLAGTVLMNARGNWATPSPTLDGPAANMGVLPYWILVGASQFTDGTTNSQTHCSLTAGGRCALNSSDPATWDFSAAIPYGVASKLTSPTDAVNGFVCPYNAVTGKSEATFTGVCSLNAKIRCGAVGNDIPRSSFGCGNLGVDGFDYGTCQGFVDQLAADQVAGKRIALGLFVSHCSDNASSSADCSGSAGGGTGAALYVTEPRLIQGPWSCASGRNTFVGIGSSLQDSGAQQGGWPFPWGNFHPGGPQTNYVFAIDTEKWAQGVGGFENITFMPASWLGRNSATASAACLSGGTGSTGDDEKACDTQGIVGLTAGRGAVARNLIFFNMSTATTSALDSGGWNVDSLVERSTFVNLRRGLVADLGRATWRGNFFFNDRRQGSASGNSGNVFATWGPDVVFENNVLQGMGSGGPIVSVAQASRDYRFSFNKYLNANATGVYYFGSANGFEAEGDDIIGITGPAYWFEPGTQVNKEVRNVWIHDGWVSGTGWSTSPRKALTHVVIESDATSNTTPERLENVVFDNMAFTTLGQQDSCGVWLEDDTRADTNALITESRPQVVVRNTSIRGPGSPRAVCVGSARNSAVNGNADTSRNPILEQYRPYTLSNQANGAPEPSTALVREYSVILEGVATGDDFPLAKLDVDESPVSFDCVAGGGTGLASASYEIHECDAGMSNCAPIGATVRLTATGIPESDVTFTQSTLAQGDWVKLVVGAVAWANPGTVSCSLRLTH